MNLSLTDQSDILNQLEMLTSQVQVTSEHPSEPVCVYQQPESWRCIGLGNSAAVFQPQNQMGISIKVYADGLAHLAEQEAEVYAQLGESPYFPSFYGKGKRAIYLQYREGVDICYCLTHGIFIPEQVIHDVDQAIAYAQSVGLNPADIHARNILVHQGRGFLIDVSKYLSRQECPRWKHLKQAYFSYYIKHYRPGLVIPPWVLEFIRKWYKGSAGEDIHSVAKRVFNIFSFTG